MPSRDLPTAPGQGRHQGHGGFTLLELALVLTIISLLVALIVPRAMRLGTSAKYSMVRQAGAEVAHWGMEWGERNLEGQETGATCVLNDYIQTLLGFVGDNRTTNWIEVRDQLTGEGECRAGTGAVAFSVADIVDPANQPRNPFNGLSYFSRNGGNDGNTLVAGLLYLSRYRDAGTTPATNHYYLVFTGTESRSTTQWHAGMGQGTRPGLGHLKNGIFMARLVE